MGADDFVKKVSHQWSLVMDDANENDGTDEGTCVPASCFSLTPLDVRSVRKIQIIWKATSCDLCRSAYCFDHTPSFRFVLSCFKNLKYISWDCQDCLPFFQGLALHPYGIHRVDFWLNEYCSWLFHDICIDMNLCAPRVSVDSTVRVKRRNGTETSESFSYDAFIVAYRASCFIPAPDNFPVKGHSLPSVLSLSIIFFTFFT